MLYNTKAVKQMLPVANLLGTQHFKACNGFSSLINNITNIAFFIKNLIISNVCINLKIILKTFGKYVILLYSNTPFYILYIYDYTGTLYVEVDDYKEDKTYMNPATYLSDSPSAPPPHADAVSPSHS